MTYFAFRLDRIDVKFQRGKLQDVDLIVFSVLINQVGRGKKSMVANAPSGSQIGFAFYPNYQGRHDDMFIGPFDIKADDSVTVVYFAMNTSNSQLNFDQDQFDRMEIKLLDIGISAIVGAPELGLIGAALGTALGAIGDPVGKILGFSPEGPCNGLVFSDAIPFSGSNLGSLPFTQEGYFKSSAFSRSYTDAATHNSDVCGHIAETDVHFSVLKFDTISVRDMTDIFFSDSRLLKTGIRQFGKQGLPISVRGLFIR
jgi:hypothetical protein